MRYFIEISYHGQAYHGWQIQKNAHTVQEELNQALKTLFRSEVETVGSGRTDAGVHALQQFCHLDLAMELDIQASRKRLNSILPSDIAVNAIYRVPSNAHARYDAVSRSYRYYVNRTKDPFQQYTSYRYWEKLDVGLMNKACLELVGERDFKSFSKVNTSVAHFRCQLTQAKWVLDNEAYTFYVSANRFLRGMVRSLVGTLMDLGTGKTSIDQFREIVESGDRTRAGRSVPPQGLFLTTIQYPEGLLNKA